MFTIDGAALSFADARELEKKCVDQAVSEGDPDRYMLDVAGEVAAAVVRYADLPVSWNGEDSDADADAQGPGDEEGVDWIANRVTAFVGGGDNGGDALYACAILARGGIGATAYLLKKCCHRRALAAAQEAGVRIIDLGGQSLRSIENTPAWSEVFLAHAWIDGIVGTGAHGPLTGLLAESVEVLNRLSAIKPRPVIAIDVPSGLTDDDGAITGPILRATHTLAVGTYKRAQVLPPAVEFTGDISLVTMDWDSNGTGRAQGDDGVIGADDLYVVDEAFSAHEVVPIPAFSDDKYARGVVGLVAGSDTYPGAGLLATRGALAAGVGMVRLNSTRRVQDLVLADQPGVVTVGGRIQSALIGPGLDEDRREDALELAQFCGQSGMPLVIDAWALDLVPELLGSLKPDVTVLTPHYGEAARLLGRLGAPVTRAEVAAAPLRYARALHEATGCHVVLKGPVTIVYSFEYVDADVKESFQRALNSTEAWPDVDELAHGQLVRSYMPTVGQVTTSWAGVAGNGDVLAGFLAGVLARPLADAETVPGLDGKAQAVTPARLSAAVALHGRAASLAAERGVGRVPIQASDIAASIALALADPTR